MMDCHCIFCTDSRNEYFEHRYYQLAPGMNAQHYVNRAIAFEKLDEPVSDEQNFVLRIFQGYSGGEHTRDFIGVNGVRNQGYNPCCWAFAVSDIIRLTTIRILGRFTFDTIDLVAILFQTCLTGQKITGFNCGQALRKLCPLMGLCCETYSLTDYQSAFEILKKRPILMSFSWDAIGWSRLQFFANSKRLYISKIDWDNIEIPPDPEGGRHAVVVIGYMIDCNNVRWLVIKNSWGESWFHGGYFCAQDSIFLEPNCGTIFDDIYFTENQLTSADTKHFQIGYSYRYFMFNYIHSSNPDGERPFLAEFEPSDLYSFIQYRRTQNMGWCNLCLRNFQFYKTHSCNHQNQTIKEGGKLRYFYDPNSSLSPSSLLQYLDEDILFVFFLMKEHYRIDPIIGTWVRSDHENTEITFERNPSGKYHFGEYDGKITAVNGLAKFGFQNNEVLFKTMKSDTTEHPEGIEYVGTAVWRCNKWSSSLRPCILRLCGGVLKGTREGEGSWTKKIHKK